jgi:uncharacterized Tic20 family protein
MIDVKRLNRKYPHLALGCCGICFCIVPAIVARNLKLVDKYCNWRLPHWAMLAVLAAQIGAIVIGAVLVGGAILWGLHRRRSMH